jgi:hypothetical protein
MQARSKQIGGVHAARFSGPLGDDGERGRRRRASSVSWLTFSNKLFGASSLKARAMLRRWLAFGGSYTCTNVLRFGDDAADIAS